MGGIRVLLAKWRVAAAAVLLTAGACLCFGSVAAGDSAGKPVAVVYPDLGEPYRSIFASIVDGTVRGVTAIAAPVFDGFGTMVLALTAIGPSATLSPDIDAPAARSLRACAEALSARLGARPQPGPA